MTISNVENIRSLSLKYFQIIFTFWPLPASFLFSYLFFIQHYHAFKNGIIPASFFLLIQLTLNKINTMETFFSTSHVDFRNGQPF